MRIIFDILIFATALLTPFWLFVSVAILGVFFIPKWYEVVVVFAFFDLLFRGDPFFTSPLHMVPLALYALLFIQCGELLRKRVRENVV